MRRYFKHTDTCYYVLLQGNMLEYHDRGSVQSVQLPEDARFLCSNANGHFVVESAAGELLLGCMDNGVFLNIYKKPMGPVTSAVMVGEGLYSICVVSMCDAIVRLPYGVNAALGMGVPKVTRDNGHAMLLSMHGGRGLAIVSEQGSMISYDPQRMNTQTALLFNERRAVLENVGAPADVTPPATPYQKLLSAAPWYMSSRPKFATTVKDIYLFVQRNNLILTLTIVASRSALVTTPVECTAKTLFLLATEDTIIEATVHNDVALVATAKGIWKVPLKTAKSGLARTELCYSSFKHINGWTDLEHCMFLDNTLMCPLGRTLEC